MVWLETINIRSAGVIEARKALELCSRIAQSATPDAALRVRVYCNAIYTTDVSIHLEWNSDPGPSSVLGNELTEALRDFGLINHTVWIEQEYPAGLPVLETGQNPARRKGMAEVSILGEKRRMAHKGKECARTT